MAGSLCNPNTANVMPTRPLIGPCRFRFLQASFSFSTGKGGADFERALSDFNPHQICQCALVHHLTLGPPCVFVHADGYY